MMDMAVVRAGLRVSRRRLLGLMGVLVVVRELEVLVRKMLGRRGMVLMVMLLLIRRIRRRCVGC